MNTDNTQDGAEPSLASAGSHGPAILSWEQADQIIQDQRAEIARLKEAVRRIAERDATLSVQGGDVVVTMDATLFDREREAIEGSIRYWRGGFRPHPYATVLSQLLRRLQQLK
jgi:hypothetical protein